jgi:hypothetical protein
MGVVTAPGEFVLGFGVATGSAGELCATGGIDAEEAPLAGEIAAVVAFGCRSDPPPPPQPLSTAMMEGHSNERVIDLQQSGTRLYRWQH